MRVSVRHYCLLPPESPRQGEYDVPLEDVMGWAAHFDLMITTSPTPGWEGVLFIAVDQKNGRFSLRRIPEMK